MRDPTVLFFFPEQSPDYLTTEILLDMSETSVAHTIAGKDTGMLAKTSILTQIG